jgi:hypothetical protein
MVSRSFAGVRVLSEVVPHDCVRGGCLNVLNDIS